MSALGRSSPPRSSQPAAAALGERAPPLLAAAHGEHPPLLAAALGERGLPPIAALRAEGLVVWRGERLLLDHVDLSLFAGVVTTLRGASGSGKTTLLRVLSSLAFPDEGIVALAGAPESVAPEEYRRRVAYVFQHPPALEGTVLDDVGTGPRLSGHTVPKGALMALLDRVGLAGHAGRVARTLSGGERQRLALARALANEPAVILLDEPTSSLDADAANGVLELVRELAAAGMAVLLVTHSEAQNARFSGPRLALANGQLSSLVANGNGSDADEVGQAEQTP